MFHTYILINQSHTLATPPNQMAINQKPFQLVLTKRKDVVRRIVSTNISRQLITMTNISIINPTIKYPLTSTCFNDQQIDTIHKSIHPTIIAEMGYSSKWLKALRYGTHNYCSLKFKHYGLEQRIQKIETIHRCINNKDFKHLATNMIDYFQLASGIRIPVLENKKWKIKYVNRTWTTSLGQELQQYNIQLKVQPTFQLTKQRINDLNIMENELTNNDQLTIELKQFNACRLFLQVNYLSELTTIDSKTLYATIIGANITNRSESNLIWPNQLQPKLKYWTRWIKKIKQRYCISNSLQLKEQFILGKWIQLHHKLTYKY